MRVTTGFSFCASFLVFTGLLRADTLFLSSASPAEIVQVNAPTLNPAVNNVNVYSGVLNWINQSVTPQQSLQSFCIDINHDIGLGGTYTYTLGGAVNTSSNGGDALLNSTVVKQIYTLWNQHGNADLTLYTNGQANAFQTALWDLLYNGGSSTGAGPLTITSTDAGIESNVQLGFQWASDAAAAVAANPNIPTGNYLNTMIFTSASGQEQIYIGNPSGAPVPTPLPSSLGAGLVLLGLVGVLRLRPKPAC
jgi:hypothetical protein